MDDTQREIRAAYRLGNQVMLRFLVRHVAKHGPLSEVKLRELTVAKNELLEIYCPLLAEKDPEVNYAWFNRHFRLRAAQITGIPNEETTHAES